MRTDFLINVSVLVITSVVIALVPIKDVFITMGLELNNLIFLSVKYYLLSKKIFACFCHNDSKH